MIVWILDHLDPHYYGQPDVDRHTERRESLREARDEFWRICDRENLGDARRHERWVFFYDPREVTDPYPDRVMRIGPRGGVRIEYA